MDRCLILILAFVSALLGTGSATTTSTVPTTPRTTVGRSCGAPPVVPGARRTINGTVVNYQCISTRKAMQGSRTIQCLNTNWTAPPQCIDVYCPEPPHADQFSNSRRSYWSRWSRGYPGRTVTYSCLSGYNRIGNDYRTTCLANFTWSQLNFECQAKDCGNVPELENGVNISVTSTTSLGIITYKCNTGYFMEKPTGDRSDNPNATAEVRCEIGRWSRPSAWSALPRCYPLSCGESPTVLDASKRVIGENLYQDMIIYECPENYHMIGNNTITCGADTKWSPEPSCNMIRCSKDPGDVPRGSLISLSGHSFGGEAVYECLKGSRTEKSPSIVCMRDGNWTSHPTCKLVDCGIPPSIHFGSRVYSTTNYRSNTTYACEDDFKIIGIEYIRCKEDGQWEESPLCEPLTGRTRWRWSSFRAAVKALTNPTEASPANSLILMIILSAIFILLSILLIILVITLIRVYGIQCKSSALCCISGSSASSTKLHSPKPTRESIATSFAPEDLL